MLGEASSKGNECRPVFLFFGNANYIKLNLIWILFLEEEGGFLIVGSLKLGTGVGLRATSRFKLVRIDNYGNDIVEVARRTRLEPYPLFRSSLVGAIE